MKLCTLWFEIHWISIYLTFIGWIFDKYLLCIHIIVMMSWYCNNNKCLISQIEYRLFNKTFLGNGANFDVPLRLRRTLYNNFLIGILYNTLILVYPKVFSLLIENRKNPSIL